MAKPEFMNSAERAPAASYYGLSRAEWYALSAEQRVLHYNRQKVCEHPAELSSWPELRESWSYDPYFNTPHMIPHKPNEAECECQTCDLKVGIARNEVKD